MYFLSRYLRSAAAAAIFAASCGIAQAQSSDVALPTPITSNELSGTIKARDIGDNRETTYYFAFEGEQGDIFINVVTASLNGELEVFAADGMRPLTRMVVYADSPSSETGRLIYLRKPERLILRVQGRTPGDEAASFRVKFAGSFVALKARDDEPSKPVVDVQGSGAVRVNSVGTIIGPVEKPAQQPQPTPAISGSTSADAVEPESKPAAPPAEKAPGRRNKPKVVVTEPVAVEPKEANASKPAKTPAPRRPKTPKPVEAPAADPLAGVRLVIEFKDGMRSQVALPDLLRFTVDRGTLVVIRRNGTIERYQMIDVAKVTIE